MGLGIFSFFELETAENFFRPLGERYTKRYNGVLAICSLTIRLVTSINSRFESL